MKCLKVKGLNDHVTEKGWTFSGLKVTKHKGIADAPRSGGE